jgi:hypothetical protein
MTPHSIVRSLVLVVAAAACSSITTNSRTAPNADLGRYHSYGWYNAPQSPQTVADQDIQAALASSLARKGIFHSPSNPDFLIAYHTYMQQNVEVNGWGWGWGYDYGWGGPAYYSYTEGTIVVDFIDPQSNKVFWRGTASSVIDDPNNVSQSKVNKAVAKLVNQYPVTVTAAARAPAYR